MGIPVISFAGYSNTGKTTYIEKLVAKLKAWDIRIGVIKHDSHGFEIDHKGKDTWRFSQAGAEMVAIVSNEKFAVIEQRGCSLDDALKVFHDVDVIITEGYKFCEYPKIAVYRGASGNELAGPPDEFIAIVTDTKLDTDTPQYPLDDPEPLAEFILAYIRGNRT